MDLEERNKLIAQYRDGYAAITAVLLKITPEELDASPGPIAGRHGKSCTILPTVK